MVVDKSRLAATTRLFSSAVFHQLAKKGKSPLFARLVREIGRERFSDTFSVSDVFNSAFKAIDTPGSRDEYIYKSAIAEKILLGRHSLRSASMLTEVRVEGNKADVVVLNGTSTVYEIKSERDSLSRLPCQLEAYRRAFASVNVITSEAHAERVISIAPEDVGILVLNRRGQISEIQAAKDRPERVQPASLFDVLRIQEACRVLDSLGVDVPQVPNTERFRVVRELFVDQDPAALHYEAVAVLRKSRSQFGLRDFLANLPSSLQAAALSTPIRRSDQPRLIAAVETSILEAEHWA
ncbi:sce7726 family protein [Seohaeicola sp. SP36]|uniref:sce7726 family protein n=1 Tax=unclassified Seohaeicola TaxID=2641111 RepID=UPI00237A8547|nr:MULTISPECIES: sce7726 family protein [unclassified Seohaeicola]MDD9709143.1 sce7726 family protein [Seohaeicola sp. 4SK31]MDD9737350.1 sce7726 family protein [Seohaeicola sp. SP36]